MERDSFIFYRSFYEAIKDLPAKDKTIIFEAICEYTLNGVEIELKGISKSMWALIKPILPKEDEIISKRKQFDSGKILSYMGKGMTDKEIAETIGCSVALVRKTRYESNTQVTQKSYESDTEVIRKSYESDILTKEKVKQKEKGKDKDKEKENEKDDDGAGARVERSSSSSIPSWVVVDCDVDTSKDWKALFEKVSGNAYLESWRFLSKYDSKSDKILSGFYDHWTETKKGSKDADGYEKHQYTEEQLSNAFVKIDYGDD